MLFFVPYRLKSGSRPLFVVSPIIVSRAIWVEGTDFWPREPYQLRVFRGCLAAATAGFGAFGPPSFPVVLGGPSELSRFGWLEDVSKDAVLSDGGGCDEAVDASLGRGARVAGRLVVLAAPELDMCGRARFLGFMAENMAADVKCLGDDASGKRCRKKPREGFL